MFISYNNLQLLQDKLKPWYVVLQKVYMSNIEFEIKYCLTVLNQIHQDTKKVYKLVFSLINSENVLYMYNIWHNNLY